MDEKEMKGKLMDLVQGSPLSEEDKQLWRGSLEEAPQPIVAALYGFFIDFPNAWEESTAFLKRKISALGSKDPAAWNMVLRDEEAAFAE